MFTQFALMLLTMIFLGFVADFSMEGSLKRYKSIDWWEKNYPNEDHRKDIVAARYIHGFIYSFMVHIPIIVALYYYDIDIIMFPLFITIASFIGLHDSLDNCLYDKNQFAIHSLVFIECFKVIVILILWALYSFIIAYNII
jgi:cytochrome b561